MTGKLTESDVNNLADKLAERLHPADECKLFTGEEAIGLKSLAKFALRCEKAGKTLFATILIVGLFFVLCVGLWEYLKKIPDFFK